MAAKALLAQARTRVRNIQFRNTYLSKRAISVLIGTVFSVAFLLVLLRIAGTERLQEIYNAGAGAFRGEHALMACKAMNKTASMDVWKAAEAKYKDLREDKFTIAMQTYQRPKELNDTLKVLLDEEIPSLLEIVIVWNDLDATPPDDFKSELGVPVRFRRSKRNSLNEKLWPDPDYVTQAVLLSDDDVYYHPQDLEFVFQTWRKFGKGRMTGALARCATVDKWGSWNYGFCKHDTNKEDIYSMILTNLAFAHVAFLDYYSSEDATMQKVRKYVDDGFNCEDIAMNFVTSIITGDGPLLVHGHEDYVNYVPKKGISTKSGHLKARSRCITDFADMFGCMPLVNETAHIERGVIVA